MADGGLRFNINLGGPAPKKTTVVDPGPVGKFFISVLAIGVLFLVGYLSYSMISVKMSGGGFSQPRQHRLIHSRPTFETRMLKAQEAQEAQGPMQRLKDRIQKKSVFGKLMKKKKRRMVVNGGTLMSQNEIDAINQRIQIAANSSGFNNPGLDMILEQRAAIGRATPLSQRSV